jgi:hypothetical protein
MLRPRTRLLWSAVACLLSVSMALPAVATGSSEDLPSDPAAADGGTGPGRAPLESDVAEHSSDVSEPVFTARKAGGSTAFFNVNQRTRPVAPGLEHTRYDRYDLRGWVRVNALTADLSTPGLRLDYAAAGKVSAPGPLSAALSRKNAIAGVNGDFFDIGDTGAPLGVGVDRRRGVVHGSASGWNNAFTLDRRNVARIAQTYLRASVVRKGRPNLEVTNLNAPQIHAHGIGLYNSEWGTDSRTRVLPGAGPRREVVVAARTGRVRANRNRLSSGHVPAGVLHLVGTGRGARKLSTLKVGSRVSVEYSLDQAATKVAVGGNVVLLRDGKVLAPDDREMHPRTAIGIDRDLGRIIIVAVDGRQGHSRGLTMRETGRLLKRMGAEDGLNLDGGGSSTMMARESGEPVAVVNSPSDGSLRHVPNGLGFVFAETSGRLRGIRIEPVSDTTDSHRVLQGLSRVLVARGHDEAHDPVAAKPVWRGSSVASARKGPAPRTVVVGRRTGTGRVTASAGGASGTFEVRVLGRVHRLEASVPSIALAGKGRSSGFDLRGYDAQGFGTWVQPRDVRLSYNRKKLQVRRTGRGFTVTSRVSSASDVVKATVGGRTTYVGVTVGLARQLSHPMNGPSGWKASAYPARAGASLSPTKNRHGRPGKAIAMKYSLYGKKATRAAYLTASSRHELPRRARRLGLWVRGDGRGAWLRTVVRDAGGATSTLNLSKRVTWKGWRFVSTALPTGLSQPLSLVRLHAVETNPKRKYAGTLAFDDLTVLTERVAKVPDVAPLHDPMVAGTEPLDARGLRVAVMSDARISATGGAAVARARRTMREIVATRPALVVVNGDLVARGNRAEIALARQLIREELDGKVPWRYVPGEGELGGSGDLAAYRAEFGEPLRVFDRAGTRFVLMSSAHGSFRLSGFNQLVRLRNELRKAGDDPSVGTVVVIAHHPTSDPAPGGRAELSDAREGELVEELLADFRADSRKAAAYVGSHARRFGVARRDGVPHVLAGPVSGPAAASTGSFTGWSMLRIDSGASPRLDVAFRPHVNALRINGPGTMSVGDTADVFASFGQNGRRMRATYPMNAVWPGSLTVHVGRPADAPLTAVVSYNPRTGKLTALRRGIAHLRVRVSGTTANRSVTVG